MSNNVQDLLGDPVLDSTELDSSSSPSRGYGKSAEAKKQSKELKSFELKLEDDVRNSKTASKPKEIDNELGEKSESIWLKIGGEGVNKRLEETGSTPEEIKRFQIFRFIKAFTAMVVVIGIGLVIKEWIVYAFAIFTGLVVWFFEYLRVINYAKSYHFQRRLDFTKFIRQIMPYLVGGEVTLYQAFERMVDKMPDGITRTALIKMLTQLNSNPDSIKPYEDFAREASGEAKALLIMQTLYDFQRSSGDSTTIAELSEMVDEELKRNVREIVDKKDNRFELEFFLLTFSLAIPMFGYGIGRALMMLSDLNLN